MMCDISTLFYSHMIKYTKLSELISKNYNGSEATRINLFIDLYPVLKSLYKHQGEYILKTKHEFVYGILSTISHYRSFFKSLDVYPNIYFIYSINCPEINRKICSGYNNSMYKAISETCNPKLNDYLNEVVNFLLQFFRFVPNTNYFIPTTLESGVIIKRIIEEDPDTSICPNIILSKDLYLLQLVAEDFNTSLLKPIKYNGEDNSIIISAKDPNEFWKTYCHFRHIKNFNFPLNPSSINMINSLCSLPERDLKGSCNITSVIKWINENNLSESEINKRVYEGRRNAVSIKFQYELYKDSPEFYMFDSYMDKIYDPERFKNYLNENNMNIDPINI